MNRRAAGFIVVAASCSLGAWTGLRAQSATRSWTIVGAQIADGSGAPLRAGNVRIVGKRIDAVGDVAPGPGDSVIDAKGLIVAPGFIDIHNHSASELAKDPAAESQVAQGITSVVVGPDGSSPWPIWSI